MEGLSGISGLFSSAGSYLSEAFQSIDVNETIKSTGEVFTNARKAMGSLATEVEKAFTSTKEAFQSLNVNDTITGVSDSLKDGVTFIQKNIPDVAQATETVNSYARSALANSYTPYIGGAASGFFAARGILLTKNKMDCVTNLALSALIAAVVYDKELNLVNFSQAFVASGVLSTVCLAKSLVTKANQKRVQESKVVRALTQALSPTPLQNIANQTEKEPTIESIYIS